MPKKAVSPSVEAYLLRCAGCLLAVFAPFPALSLAECAFGPGLVGVLSDAVQKVLPKAPVSLWGENTFALTFGLLLSAAFPLIMLLLLYRQRKDPYHD